MDSEEQDLSSVTAYTTLPRRAGRHNNVSLHMYNYDSYGGQNMIHIK